MRRLIFISVLLCWGSALSADDSPSFGKSMTWTTADGVRLVGLYQPQKALGGTTWVLLHGLGSEKYEWLPLARKLAAKGDGVLIYDARGHGQSIHRVSGSDISYKQFRSVGPGSEWNKMPSDLASAVDELTSHYGLHSKQVAVGGASVGANVALVYAAAHPDVPALILLSPGLEYAGIAIERAFRRYGTRPVFIAASPGDVYAFESVRQLVAQRTDANSRAVSGEGAAHGTNMFNEIFLKKLVDWTNSLSPRR